jgi:hypothetical protein
VSTEVASRFEARSEAIRAGERAPEFALQTANVAAGRNVGDAVSLKELIARGPVIVEFLRGTW